MRFSSKSGLSGSWSQARSAILRRTVRAGELGKSRPSTLSPVIRPCMSASAFLTAPTDPWFSQRDGNLFVIRQPRVSCAHDRFGVVWDTLRCLLRFRPILCCVAIFSKNRDDARLVLHHFQFSALLAQALNKVGDRAAWRLVHPATDEVVRFSFRFTHRSTLSCCVVDDTGHPKGQARTGA
jgi:hypothetical protein